MNTDESIANDWVADNEEELFKEWVESLDNKMVMEILWEGMISKKEYQDAWREYVDLRKEDYIEGIKSIKGPIWGRLP